MATESMNPLEEHVGDLAAAASRLKQYGQLSRLLRALEARDWELAVRLAVQFIAYCERRLSAPGYSIAHVSHQIARLEVTSTRNQSERLMRLLDQHEQIDLTRRAKDTTRQVLRIIRDGIHPYARSEEAS